MCTQHSLTPIPNDCHSLQLEQELGLVLSKQGLQRSFSTEWIQKWVPSVTEYSRGLERKDIKAILAESVCTYMYIALGDDDGDQKMALKLLFQLLCVARKGENCLNYLFAHVSCIA